MSVRTLPKLHLDLGDTSIEGVNAASISELRVQHRASLPSQCEIAFVDPKPEFVDSLAPGTTLKISVADEAGVLFEGELTALEFSHGPSGRREVRIRGYDLLHRLRKRQPVRSHVKVTLKALAQELVASDGLTVRGEGGSEPWPHLIQNGQSDFELLADLAEKRGVQFSVRDGALLLYHLEGSGEEVELALGDGLLRATVEVNADLACREVIAHGWSPADGLGFAASAGSSQVGRQTKVTAAPGSVHAAADRTLVDVHAPDVDHALRHAQAELDRRSASEVVLRALANGDTAFFPGAAVRVVGMSARIDGRYVLTGVTHTVDPDMGFISELTTAPPPRRPRRTGSAILPGVVSRVDDPDTLGRVRATLPTHNDVETDWLQVVAPGAGKNKGLMMVPDVGDVVVLAVSNDDPARGVVLGGLYGPRGMKDSGVHRGAVKKFTFRTASGHRVVLDDRSSVLSVTSSSGHRLKFAPKEVLLHAESDLTIEAPGKAIVIRGNTVDFQRG